MRCTFGVIYPYNGNRNSKKLSKKKENVCRNLLTHKTYLMKNLNLAV